jgi:Ras-related protein Rab-21
MVLSVVGNKTDLESQRKVTREEAMQYAASIGGNYFESSALHDEGDVVFNNMTIQYQVLLVSCSII